MPFGGLIIVGPTSRASHSYRTLGTRPMPFRPEPAFRRNITGVVLPLTAAIAQLYGIRSSDGAYPLGAFYTENIDSRVWRKVDDIWHQPLSPDRIHARRISEARIQQFARSIVTGEAISLRNGTTVTWEPLPESVAQQLPALRWRVGPTHRCRGPPASSACRFAPGFALRRPLNSNVRDGYPMLQPHEVANAWNRKQFRTPAIRRTGLPVSVYGPTVVRPHGGWSGGYSGYCAALRYGNPSNCTDPNLQPTNPRLKERSASRPIRSNSNGQADSDGGVDRETISRACATGCFCNHGLLHLAAIAGAVFWPRPLFMDAISNMAFNPDARTSGFTSNRPAHGRRLALR